MARKVKSGGKVTKRSGRAARPRPAPKKAKRLPSGSYAWKGKAIPFSRLPKVEKTRIRSGWAAKATKVRAAAAAKVAGRKGDRAAREWVKRRTKTLGIEGDGRYRAPEEIAAEMSSAAILAARAAQKAAHVAWVRQGKHGGGKALMIAESIRASVGEEIAAAMPQLWWYH